MNLFSTVQPPNAITLVSIAAASTALFLALAAPLLSGRVFVYGDLQAFHIPLRQDYQQALIHGDSILWTPSILSGFYIFGEGQIGMLHPLHQILYRALPLAVAINLEMLASYAFAFAGEFWLLTRLGAGVAASAFGAMLFAFCGFNLLHIDHVNVVAVVAHLPWLLAATHVLFTTDRRAAAAAAVAGVALLFTSGFLLGFAQAVWWCALTGTLFAILLAYRTRGWSALGWFLAASLIAVALGAVQIVPTADVSARSIRPLFPHDFALSFSLHPLNVLQLWSPYVFRDRIFTVSDAALMHEFGMYSGAVLPLAAAWLWLRRRALGATRPWIVAAASFAAVAFVMALGRYGGITPLLARLPVFDSLRAPARYIVLFQFCAAALAAFAFADLLEWRREGRRLARKDVLILCIPAALSVATTIALNMRVFAVARAIRLSTVPDALVGVFVMSAATLLMLAIPTRRWAAPAFVVFCALDLGLWGIREAYRVPPQTIAALTESVPPPTAGPGGQYAYVADFHLPGNLLLLRGYRLATGYVALYPATHFHLSSTISRALSGTGWEFTIDHRRVPMPDPVPRARLLDRVRVSSDMSRDWSTVDLHEAALLDHDVGALSGPPGTVTIVSDRPGHIVADIDAPGRQLLSISERHHPGWSATSEGSAIETVAVHGDFLGAIVPPGRHRIAFDFLPRSFVVGRRISVAGAAALVAAVALVATWPPARRRVSSARSSAAVS